MPNAVNYQLSIFFLTCCFRSAAEKFLANNFEKSFGSLPSRCDRKTSSYEDCTGAEVRKSCLRPGLTIMKLRGGGDRVFMMEENSAPDDTPVEIQPYATYDGHKRW